MTILQEAARGSSVWVTSQVVDEGDLRRRVSSLLTTHGSDDIRVVSVPGDELRDMVGESVSDHVAGWIGAGYAHERLLGLSPKPDVVVCLDPWAAMLGGHALLAQARWLYLAGFHPCRAEDSEYWAATEDWLEGRVSKLAGILPTLFDFDGFLRGEADPDETEVRIG